MRDEWFDRSRAAPPAAPAGPPRGRPSAGSRSLPDTIYGYQPPLFAGRDIRTDWPWGDLAPYSYDVIMIDPPWAFANWSPKGEAKGVKPHYQTMPDAAIAALPVADLASEDCLLWLWATSPKLDTAIDCLRGWGFQFVTAGAWNKRRWGTGYVWRSVCEPILIGAIGAPKARGAAIPNILHESAREHSRKPDAAYQFAERMVPGARRRADVFAREMRPGWEAFGDEVGKFDEVAGCR